MKQDIHPQYHEKATIKCSCGASHVVGSAKEKAEIEICSECHPFYTGKEKLVDTAGRVEKFKSRQEKAKPRQAKSKKPAIKKTTTEKKSVVKSTAKNAPAKKAAVKKAKK